MDGRRIGVEGMLRQFFNKSPNCQIAMNDRLLKWFEYSHLPPHLQVVSKEFFELATFILYNIDDGPERTVALRKLLEAKDAAVRAKLHPGG